MYPLQKVLYPRLNMSMATRIIASIFLMLLSNLSNLTLELVATHGGNKEKHATCQLFARSNDYGDNHRVALNYRWLIIPQIITSLSHYLFCTSGTEFVVSQCSYAMRGLIIGAVCTTYGVFSGLYGMSLGIVLWLHNSSVKGFKSGNCGVWYYLAYALTSLLLLFGVLIIDKKCYKYRKRDEDIHNKQMFAENYYKKYLPLPSQ